MLLYDRSRLLQADAELPYSLSCYYDEIRETIDRLFQHILRIGALAGRQPTFTSFGRPLRVTVCPMLWDRCLSVLSVTLVYCGETVGWIKMPLVTEVGLGPGDVVLDGDPAPFNTMSHGPKPTSVTSGILIHPAVWPQ